jgi:hypothetical protein
LHVLLSAAGACRQYIHFDLDCRWRAIAPAIFASSVGSAARPGAQTLNEEIHITIQDSGTAGSNPHGLELTFGDQTPGLADAHTEAISHFADRDQTLR